MKRKVYFSWPFNQLIHKSIELTGVGLCAKHAAALFSLLFTQSFNLSCLFFLSFFNKFVIENKGRLMDWLS